MARPEFSETHFVFGYLREYTSRFPFFPHPFWGYSSFELPSTIEEARGGADYILRYHMYSEFIQFKRSECLTLNVKRRLRSPECNFPDDFFPYYRFDVYNEEGSRQFEKLRDISMINPDDEAYYCAPLFYKKDEYNGHFRRQSIIANSILIDCSQFNTPDFLPPNFDIRSGRHSFVYNTCDSGFLLSEPKELHVRRHSRRYDDIRFIDKSPEQSYIELRKIVNWCIEDAGNDISLNEVENQNSRLNLAFAFNHLYTNYNIIWMPIIR